MINVFQKLLNETDNTIIKMSSISDKEVAKHFIDSNIIIRESYKSFIDGLKWCINEQS
jgi:hypothetical protein